MNGVIHRSSRFVAIIVAIVAVLGALDGCLVTCLSESAPADMHATEAVPPCHHAATQTPAGLSWQADASCHEHHHQTTWFEASTTVRVASPMGVAAAHALSSALASDARTSRSFGFSPPDTHTLTRVVAFAPLRI